MGRGLRLLPIPPLLANLCGQGGIKIVPSSCDDLPAASTQHSERQGPPSTCKNLKAGIDSAGAPESVQICNDWVSEYAQSVDLSRSAGLAPVRCVDL